MHLEEARLSGSVYKALLDLRKSEHKVSKKDLINELLKVAHIIEGDQERYRGIRYWTGRVAEDE